MEESASIDSLYKEKTRIYIYYHDPSKEINHETDLETIWEMEEMKQYFEQLDTLGMDYKPILQNEMNERFFEKIYYQDSNSYIILYNAAIPIQNFSFTINAIHQAMDRLPPNFDILLFKEFRDHNQISKWVSHMKELPSLAVIRKDGLFKISYKLWNQIQVYYSGEEVRESFYHKWENYFLDKFENLFDWFGETIYSI